MRSKVAKHLRREAAQEMTLDKVPDRDLVMGRNSVVNSPSSVRALYLKLKFAFSDWKSRRNGSATRLAADRVNKPSTFHRPLDLLTRPALILSPLKQLLTIYPATLRPDGLYDEHPVCRQARRAAKNGDGVTLRRLAALHV